MNRQSLNIVSALVIMLCCCQYNHLQAQDDDAGEPSNQRVALSGTYTIGGTNPDFETFNGAVAALNSEGVVDAVLFNVRNGTYTEQISLLPYAGPDVPNTVTFQSESGDSTAVVLQFSSNSTDNYTVDLKGADGITFRNMTIQATDLSFGRVLSIGDSANNNRIENCILQGINTSGFDDNLAVIYSGTSLDINNSFVNNSILNGSAGMFYGGLNSTLAGLETGTIIDNNRFQNQSFVGLYVPNQNSIKIRNNIIEANAAVDGGYGMYLENTEFMIEVSGNQIFGSSGGYTGIYLVYCDADSNNRGLIANNFIQLGGNGAWGTFGLYPDESTYQDFYHNNIHITNVSDFNSAALLFYHGTDIRLVNNIFANVGGGYAIDNNSTTNVTFSDFNNLYATGTNLGSWDADQIDLAAWQAASGMDINSLSVDPLFTSESDLHVSNISLYQAGTPLGSVTTDIDGDIRDPLNPDIGADEFTPPNNDAGVVAIVSPLSPIAEGANDVVIRLKNFGLNTITSTNIEWEINGAAQAPYSFNGNLASNNTIDLTIGSSTFLPNIDYDFRAWSTLAEDGLSSNDTTILLNQRTGLNGIYTIGGVSPDFVDFTEAVTAINLNGVVDSAVFNVRNGTYTEQISINEYLGPEAKNTVIFQSESGVSSAVVLTFDSPVNNYIVDLQGADGVTFQNMTIEATGVSYGRVISIRDGADNNHIENCTLQGVISNSVHTNHAIIYSPNTKDNNNTFVNNRFFDGSQGIVLFGPISFGDQRESGIIIENNLFQNQASLGINVQWQQASKIRNNVLESSSTYNGSYGIVIASNGLGIEVTGNKISDSGSGFTGIYVDGCNGNSETKGLVANNFVFISGISVGIGPAQGIFSDASNYQHIYHNSVHITNSNAASNSAIRMWNGGNIELANNVFANSGGGYAVYTNSTTNITASDFNALFSTGASLTYRNGDLSDLSSWQASSGLDGNSLSVMPVFISESDLHLSHGPLNNIGTPIPSVTTDIDGDLRHPLNPDIGADEFDPPNNDAGVVSIISPRSPAHEGVNDMVIRLMNFGLDAINSLNIEWEINGVEQVPFNFAGNLESNNTIDLTIGSATFLPDVLYDLKAWSALPGDEFVSNDTTELLGLLAGLSGIYTVGGTSPDFVDFSAAVSALNQRGVADFVQFNVRNGIYSEQITLLPYLGPNYTNTSNTVTFQSESGDNTDVILEYAANSDTANFTVDLKGADGVTFLNMTIKATGADYGRVFCLSDSANNNRIENCILEGVFLTDGSNNTNHSIIYSAVSHNPPSDIRTLDVNNSFVNNSIINGYCGVYYGGLYAGINGLETGTIIEGNHFLNQYQIGIYLVNQNAPKIRNNLIESSSSFDNGYYGLFLTSNELMLEVTGNKILCSSSDYNTGIYMNGCTAESDARALVANNFIQVGGTRGAHGIQTRESDFLNIYHNNVHVNSTSVDYTSWANFNYGGSNIRLCNNIFANFGDGFAMGQNGDGLDIEGIITYSDHNDFYTTGDALMDYPWAEDLEAWQIAFGTDSNSISVDPVYTSDIDLHIHNELLDDAGTPIANITTDIDGENRDPLHPDIGADEFSVIGNDAGILAILSPLEPFLIGQQDVLVALKNYGVNDLESVAINWSINGSLQTVYNWVGLLPADGSEEEVVLGTSVFDTAVAYNITAWTNLPNGAQDQDISNDTASVNDQYALSSAIITIIPESIDTIFLGCSDSVLLPLTIYNTGSEILAWSIDGLNDDGGLTEWLFVSGDSNSTAIGDSAVIIVQIGANQIVEDEYHSEIIINANDFFTPQIVIPIDLIITGDPLIVLSDTSLDFGVIPINTSIHNAVTIYNDGCDDLIVSNISINNAAFSSNLNSFTIAPYDNQVVIVTFSAIGMGEFTGQLTLQNSDRDTAISLYGHGCSAIPTIIAEGLTTLCPGDSVQLTSDVAENILWSNGEITSSIFAKEEGSYSVVYSDSLGCVSVSNVIDVRIVNDGGITPPGDNTICFGDEITLTANIVTDTLISLSAGFAGDRPYDGHMFDITAINAVSISNFEGHFQGDADINVYYREGSHVGFESDFTAWTLVGSAINVTAQPIGSPTPIPIIANVTIPAGATYGFLITSTSGQLQLCSTATSIGSVFAADDNILIKVGVSNIYPFGEVSVARKWNGNVNYRTSEGFDGQYLWSTGDMTPSITVSPTDTIIYSVTTTSQIGCVHETFSQVNVIPFIFPAQVSNMVPVNGMIDVPQPVSFSWLPSSYTTFYDLYVWPSTDPQPLTPYVANLNQISYLYPPYLTNGATYNWQIVSRNNCLLETEGPIQSFTTINRPDLTVISVQAPPSAFTGQSINVDWEVNNIGSGSTNNNQWIDAVYLSADTLLDTDVDVYLGGVGNQSALDAGEGYLNTSMFTLPVDLTGNYYVIVHTDPWNSLLETSYDNNVMRTATAMLVNLTPPPDLRVTSIIHPSTIFSGQDVNLTWTVSNDGSGVTTNNNWADRIYFSSDEIFTGDELEIATFSHTGHLEVDSSYIRTETIALPPNIFGRYFFYIQTDINNDVYEHVAENNNNSRSDSINVILTPPPDLVVTSISIPDSASTEESISIEWTVQNIGATAPLVPRWTDAIYIASDPNYDLTNAILLHNRQRHGTINPGASYNAQVSVNIPSGIAAGPYYIYVTTDNYLQVFEFMNEDNNTRRSDEEIQILNPDLIVSEVTSPASGSSGQEILVQWEVENTGPGTVFSDYRADRIALSTSATYDTANLIELDVVYDEIEIVMLPGQSIARQKVVTLPNAIDGDYYLYVYTDYINYVYEHLNEGNNVNSNGTAIEIEFTPWPDLLVSEILLPDTATAGEDIQIEFSVLNQGIGSVTTSNWKDKIYITSDSTWDGLAGIPLLSTISNSQLVEVDSSYTVHRTVELPPYSADGIFYIYVFADRDDDIYEHLTEDNNMLRSSFFVKKYPPVDLAVVSISGPVSTTSGGLVNIAWTVENVGSVGTIQPSWTDAIYLSIDTFWHESIDIRVDQWDNVAPLNPGESYSQNQSFNMPNEISGSYYLLAVADWVDYNSDVDRSNNYKILSDSSESNTVVEIELSTPRDLVISSFTAPLQAISGQPIEVYWTVNNQGAGPTINGTWTDFFYLSDDYEVDSDDIGLTGKSRSGNLASGESYIDTLDIFIPIHASGNYLLIARTDKNNSEYEHLAEDNNLAIRPIIVEQPLPADLVVTNIIHPDNAIAGSNIDIEWTVKNLNPVPATGYMKDLIYLSIDDQWSIDDVLFGEVDGVINLAPQAEFTRNLTSALAGLSIGQYYIIVRTDILNNIYETDDDNNTTASEGQLNIGVKELPLNQWVDDSLADLTGLYYRIEIADSLIGQSLLVLLKADSINGNNEFYIRYGDVPTRVNYDYSHQSPYDGNQELIVPTLQMGTYYLLTYGSTSVGNVQSVSLFARILDFEIRSVNADEGGNTGLVTIQVNGAKFDGTMMVCLAANGDTICAQDHNLLDAVTLFATFDLTGAATGIYNVVGEKDNGEVAILENGFTIVSGLPPELQMNVHYPSTAVAFGLVAMTVDYANTGNIDIVNPVAVMNSLGGAPISFTVEGLPPASLYSNHFGGVEFDPLPDEYLILDLYLEELNGIPGILRPGANGSIIIYTRSGLFPNSPGLAFNLLLPDLD